MSIKTILTTGPRDGAIVTDIRSTEWFELPVVIYADFCGSGLRRWYGDDLAYAMLPLLSYSSV